MKVYKAKLHTGGKTREQIIERNTPLFPMSEAEINQTLEFYNMLDGAVVGVSELAGDYALVWWPEEEASRSKEANYLAEQDTMFGTYINEREEFDKDWDAGNYAPDASMTFDVADVEIIEELSVEA